MQMKCEMRYAALPVFFAVFITLVIACIFILPVRSEGFSVSVDKEIYSPQEIITVVVNGPPDSVFTLELLEDGKDRLGIGNKAMETNSKGEFILYVPAFEFEGTVTARVISGSFESSAFFEVSGPHPKKDKAGIASSSSLAAGTRSIVSPPGIKLIERGGKELASEVRVVAKRKGVNGDREDIEIIPLNGKIKRMLLRGVVSAAGGILFDDVPEDVPSPDGVEWREVFAIDPAGTRFSDGNIVITAKGRMLYKCSSWDFSGRRCNGSWVKVMDIVPGENYTINISQGDPAFGEADIDILNVQSYPVVGGVWEVRFETRGTENLTIRTVDGTSWSENGNGTDLRFLGIACGNRSVSYEWVNGSVFIENYFCNETGYERSAVLTSGKHVLEFSFGNDTEYARNQAFIKRVVGEWGHETDLQEGSWRLVRFNHTFDDTPVVVHYVEYDYVYDNIPCATRIKNVTRNGFYARAESWDSNGWDDNCPSTGVNMYWLAMEKGIHNITDANNGNSRIVEVRNFTMSSSACGAGANPADWTYTQNERIFQYSWSTRPAVLASVQTANDDDSIIWYIHGCGTQSAVWNNSCVEIGMSGMENDGTAYQPCTLHTSDEEGGYIAWEIADNYGSEVCNTYETGNGSNTYTYELCWDADSVQGSENDPYPMELYYVTLSQTYSDGACFGSNTEIDGGNGLYPATDFDAGTNRCYFLAEEDENGDEEQAHITEPWLAVFFNSSSGFLYSNETVINIALEANGSFSGTGVINYNASAVFAGNCTETRGNLASGVYIILQDNSSGSWQKTQTSGSDFYSNESYYFIGALSGNTSENYYFNITGNTLGSYYFRVQCNSSEGLMENSTASILVVTDMISPEWSNLGSNTTNPAVDDSVKFYAEWQDGIGLGSWTFSWNGTVDSSWENVSGDFSSNPGWSNITRNIPSYLAGKQVGYRFYANDSYGNINSTDIGYILVQSLPDLTPPDINWFNSSPVVEGYGRNVTIRANITDDVGVDANNVWANVTYPNGSSYLYQMVWKYGDIYEYVFYETWQRGNYSFWVKASDTSSNENSSTKNYPKNFTIEGSIALSVRTKRDAYGPDSLVLLGEREWWDSAWSYRRQINITENAGQNLTSYPVNITVDTATLISQGKMNSDCSDMRFADPQNNELPFWISGGCGTSATTVFVRLPYLNASSTESIYMYYGNSDATETASSFSDTWKVIGEVRTVRVNSTWHFIQLSNSYVAPVIVNGPADFAANQDEEVVGRIRNVKGNSFEFRLQEPWECSSPRDDVHPYENISYIAVENGTWLLPNGQRLEAGNYTTSATSGRSITDSWDTVTYRISDFPSAPVVVSQSMGYDDSDYVKTRHQNIGTASFQVSFNEDEEQADAHGPEMLGWVACETGSGSMNGVVYQCGTTANVDRYPDYCSSSPPYDCAWQTQSFSLSFSGNPVVIASLETTSGGDNAYVRYNNPTSSSVDFGVEEDYCDGEKGGVTETVGWMVFSEASDIYAREWLSTEPGVSISGEEMIEDYLDNYANNTGGVNVSGYLLMQVWRNDTLEVLATQVDDASSGTRRDIDASGTLNIAAIWNANPWNTTGNATGWYRVYAVLTDPYGNVLVNDSGQNISAYYVFYIDNDNPLWNSLGSNESSPDPLDYVEFYANWSDMSLDSWVFEWNVSGSFVANASGSFGSGTWSNVTRQIPLDAELSTIGYRFRANDTQGNENVTDVYVINVNDVTPPSVSNEYASPSFVNRYGYVNISASVSDNSGSAAYAWARIGIPGGGYVNRSMSNDGGNVWNVSYQSNATGRYNATVYANDSSSNTGNGSEIYWEVYGWSNATWVSPSGGSYPRGSVIGLECAVEDADTGSAIGGYPVEFWDNGASMGVNYTNSSGKAVWMWNTSLVQGGLHSLNCTIADNASLYYNASVSSAGTYAEVLVPSVGVILIEHENLQDHGVNEYESGDTIDWVNVTVNNTGGADAYAVNVSLNVVDSNGLDVYWFGVQSRDCGTLSVGETCEASFSSNQIPAGISSGQYMWKVVVNWSNGGNPPSENSSEWFYVHRLGDNVSSSIVPSKVNQNQSAVYNVTVQNPWSGNITNVNVSVNCHENMTCVCDLPGQSGLGYCFLGNVSSSGTASFNITTNSSTVPGDYDINSSVEYVNPGLESRTLSGVGNSVLSVRGPTKLNVSITLYSASVTRGGLYELRGYVNYTGSGVTNNVWLNWTLPSGWSNYSGNLDVYAPSLGSGEVLWNNITVNVSLSSLLGGNEIELRAGSDEEADDWDTAVSETYADTGVPFVWVNDSGPYRNGSLRIEARLVWDNGSAVSGESVDFSVGGVYVGSNYTNGSGYAVVDAVVPYNVSLGANAVNASYSGSSSLYTNPSFNGSVSVDVQDEVRIENVQASPDSQGYGWNVSVTASVGGKVSVQSVRANVTYPNGSSQWFDMQEEAGGSYRLVFQDTWQRGNYSYAVNATNAAGLSNYSYGGEFYVGGDIDVSVSTEKGLYGGNQYVYSGPGEWWNSSWRNRIPITITEMSGTDLYEYQIRITLNRSVFDYNKTLPGGDDIRFAYLYSNGTEQEVPYYIEKWNSSGESILWVKVTEIPANQSVTVYMYYNNSYASPASNISRTFSYSQPRRVGYIVSPLLSSFAVISLGNGNNVTVGSASQLLDYGGTYTFTGVSQSDAIYAKTLFYGDGTGNPSDMYSPISWAGTEFVYYIHRGTTLRLHMLSPFGTASASMYENGTQIWSGTVGTGGVTLTEGTDFTFAVPDQLKITSDIPILVQFDTSTADARPFYPATNEEWYGIPTGTGDTSDVGIAAGANGANVSWVDSTGSTGSAVIAPEGYYNDGSFTNSQGQGPAWRVESDYPIGICSLADSDGSETTTFLPRRELGTLFGANNAMQYIAVAAPEPSTTCSLYDSSGSLVTEKTGGTRNDVNKIYFGITSGTYLSAGWKLVCNKPVFAYYEKTTSDTSGDETNLASWMQMRQYQYPEPEYSLGREEFNVSRMVSNGTVNVSGYVVMGIESNESGSWSVVSIQVNDSQTQTRRTVLSLDYLDLSSIWDSNPWNTDSVNPGWYRMFAQLTDPYGNVLVNNDGSWMNGTYLFRVSYTGPSIINSSAAPSVQGYGWNVTITAEITSDAGVKQARANVTYPNGSYEQVPLSYIGGDTWQGTFQNTWKRGVYNYTIWAEDNNLNPNETGGYSFSVSANTTMFVRTENDIYGRNDIVNLSSGYANNTGGVNVSGYLLMQVWRNDTLEVLATQVDDASSGTRRDIDASGTLNIAAIWNANPWNTTGNATGWYRVYAVLTDPYGNVLVNDSGQNISAYYVFYIDNDNPLWNSLGSNESSPDPLDYVEFYANWSDMSLDSWVFEWNVSGSFVANASGSFGSGTWSNVTRQIPLDAELSTIGYRFRANDTQGNENVTDVYVINVNDVTPPSVSNEYASPSFVNRYGYVNISASVSDNSGSAAYAWARIGIPGGGYVNRSMSNDGGNVWNVSYQSNATGRYNATVYANDSSSNTGNGSEIYWEVYGWSNATWVSPSGGSYPRGSVIGLECAVEDADTGSAIGGYPVEFWDNGASMGVNYTNSSGKAVWMWNTSLVQGGLHSLNCTIADNASLYYNASVSSAGTYAEVLVPSVGVILIEHENLQDHGVNEYESGDTIDWVNVTVNNTGGADAYAVNVSLNVVDSNGLDVYWFGVQSRDCGTLSVGETCEASFSSNQIPAGISSGQYMWKVVVNWSNGGNPPSENSSEWFYVHRLGDNVSSSIVPSKVNQNQSAVYNVTVQNPWSGNITNVNVSVNCHENMTCVCDLPGQSGLGYCFLGNVSSSGTASFNITTNSSTVPGDYDINSSVEYVNPGLESRTLSGVGNSVLSVRGPTKLNVSITLYSASVTRGGLYELRGYVNYTGSGVTNNVWLNWTLPSGWSNYSGNLDVYAPSLGSGEVLWNNITVNVSLSSLLGGNEIELRAGSDEEADDWDTAVSETYADTGVPFVWVNDSGPYRNGSLRIEARLVWDNGSAVSGESVDFSVGGVYVGSNYTNGSGYAVVDAVVPYNVSLGANAVNASYSGSSSLYTNPSFNGSVSVDVQDEVRIENVQASPDSQGYGWNVSVTASVGGKVSVQSVRANVTYPNGSSQWFDMQEEAGGSYRLVFQDTWQRGNYSYAVNATNAAGLSNYSYGGEFYVGARASAFAMTRRSLYGDNRNVSLERQEWWNRTFLYRKRINISERSGATLYEYQVNVTLDTSSLIQASKMRQDCRDVRFVAYNSTAGTYRKLSYWFLSRECGTANTTFWVRVPEIPSGGNATIYAYYGSEDALSESNITATFVFGDDFERPDSPDVGNGWVEDYPGYTSIENGMLKVDSGTSTGTYREQVHHSFSSPSMDYVMEYEGHVNQTDKYVYSNYFGPQSDMRFSIVFGGDGMLKYLNGSAFENTSMSYAANAVYTFRIRYNNSQQLADYFVNGALEGEKKNPTAGPLVNEVAFGGEFGSLSYWDNVRIRKLASREPEVRMFSEETLYSTIGNIGSVNVSGYVLAEIRNSTTNAVISVRVNDSAASTKRSITPGGYINVSLLWDTNPWNTSSQESGYYRLYVALTDPYGNVLVNDSGQNISAYYDFFVDTDYPQVVILGVNESYPRQGDYVRFYARWSDNRNLSSWTFSWNASGSWVNASSGSISGTSDWSNSTQQIPQTATDHHGFRFYAWDEAGNLNVSDIGMFTVSGWLDVTLVAPADSLIVANNVTFLANVTVVCRDGTCGNVSARIRYNQSGEFPDTDIATSFDIPFYIVGSGNPNQCGNNPLGNNEYCSITWDVNTTGTPGDSYKIGSFVQSDQPNVQSNNTNNNSVTIVSCILDTTVHWQGIDFGGLSPGQRGNAPGNSNMTYNITIENVTTCNVDVYLRADNLQRVLGGNYVIYADNLTFSNETNDYNSGYRLSSSWVLGKHSASPGSNVTTYYWIDVPYSVMEGEYNGTLYVEGVERGGAP